MDGSCSGPLTPTLEQGNDHVGVAFASDDLSEQDAECETAVFPNRARDNRVLPCRGGDGRRALRILLGVCSRFKEAYMRARDRDNVSPPPITLRTDQVRKVYGLSAEFLRRHPEIPRYRAGYRTVLYRRDDIERFLEQRRIA